MIILGIETSAKTASCALCDDDIRLGEFSVTAALNHSETLLPMIQTLLASCKKTSDEVDMLAVASGPGSFTGVRIGIASALGLAFGRNKICVGVSALEALAQNLRPVCGDECVCPVMDARREHLYNALFEYRGDTLVRLCPDRIISARELCAQLAADGRPVVFCGDGTHITSPLLPARVAPPQLLLQSAYSVARVALLKYREASDKSVFTDISLAPVYLRAPLAERERQRRLESSSEQ